MSKQKIATRQINITFHNQNIYSLIQNETLKIIMTSGHILFNKKKSISSKKLNRTEYIY